MSPAKPRAARGTAQNPTHAELFESVFNSVNSLIAYLDQDLVFIRVNKAYANANGRSQEFFIGRNHFDLFPDSAPRTDFLRVLETGAPLRVFEKPFPLLPNMNPSSPAAPSPKQTPYWDWSVEPVRGSGDRIMGLALTLIDVTERRRAKEALRVSEAHREAIISDREQVEQARTRLAAAIEQAEESVAMTDRNGVIQYVNPAFEKTTGYTREEIEGRHLRVLEGEPETSAHDAKWATVTRGEVWRGRGIRKKKSGVCYQVECSITPIRDTDDPETIAEYVVTERDISKEMALGKQLRQAQKMEALGTLAGGIAHDLNNILMPIIMNAEMIAEDVAEDGPLHHFATKVISSAHRGRNLVRRILTFSREKDAEKRRFAIAQPVEEALDLVRPTLLSTVDLIQHIAPDVGQVKGDPAEVQEMIVNLCTNAAHAIGVERGAIEVGLENVVLGEEDAALHSLVPGPFVKLSIRDTGVGMDEELMERIFDPFFTTKKSSEGTGMGLAMVHGAVRRHGGAITVTSAPRQGALFEVYLPRVAEVATEAVRVRPIPKGDGERLLLVDDEDDIVEAARNVLERLGYRVIAETTAKGALAAYEKTCDELDVIILDFALAEMTGLELAKQLREIRSGLPIIMATGFSGAVDRTEIEALGISAIVSKPLTSREVAESIRNVLDGTAPEQGKHL